jgi:hypothetical protein
MIKYILIFFAILGVLYFGLKMKFNKERTEKFRKIIGDTHFFVMDKGGLLVEIDPKKYAFTEGEKVYQALITHKIGASILYKE